MQPGTLSLQRGKLVLIVLSAAIAVGSSTATAQDKIWNVNGDGSWNAAGNWDPVGVPGLANNVFIRNVAMPADPVVVTVNPGITQEITNITIDANASPHELAISNNTFLDVHGNIDNNGIISLNSTANTTLLRADGFSPVISGTGRLVLGNGGPNGLSATANFQWTNSAGHTIEGVGNLGSNLAVFVNEGLIDANDPVGSLTLDPRNNGAGIVTFTNNATARATSGGMLVLTGNGGGEFGGAGTYQALAGSEVLITAAAVVKDATFDTTGSGVVRIADGQNVVFVDITNNGDFRVGNNTEARMFGTITNTGEITLAAVANRSDFKLGSHVTLTGGGTLTMVNANSQVNSVGNSTLTNVNNTIQGAGNLGGNLAVIVNDSLILANVNGESLMIDPRNNGAGIETFVNNSVVRATGGGKLVLSGSGGGEFGGSGTYEALAGSEIIIQTSAIVRDATFITTGSGLVRTGDSDNIFLANVTINGDFQVGNNTDAGMFGMITNTGEMTLASMTQQSDFELGSHVELNGGGTLTLSGPLAQINSVGNFTLTNVNNTIQGNGNVGGNSAAFVNNATILANVDGESLTLDPRNNGAGVVTFLHNGSATATDGGSLVLTGNGFGEFGGSGTYQAQADSEVVITNSAVVRDSTFGTTDSGVVRVADGQNVSFVDITNNGDFRVGNNTDAAMYGTITNNSEITLESVADQSDFELGSDVVLTGGGTVTLAGPIAQINSVGNFTLTNVNNTIQGTGNIGGNSAVIVNDGLILANVGGESLTLDPRNNGAGVNTFINNSVARATGGGTLILTGNGFGEFGGSGTYEAQAGSEVVITTAAVIRDSTFATAGSGVVRIADGQNVALVDVINNGDFRVGDNTDARMFGTITNNGEITLASVANQSDLELGGNVQLTGGGTLTLAGPIAQINSAGNFVLTNVDNTIRGTGNIGGNTAAISNRGLIDANGSGNVLLFDGRNNGFGIATITNELGGVMRARNAGILRVSGSGGGEFLNHDGGRVIVESTMELVTSAVFRNETGGRVEGDGVINVVNGVFNNASGTVAPGLSPGILSVTGSYFQGAAGTLEIEIAGQTPGTEHDQLAISGTANLDGIVDAITLSGQSDPAVRGGFQQTQFLTAGDINGFFGSLIYDGMTVTPLNALGPDGSFVGYVGLSDGGIDGMFRGISYTDTDATLVNYLALPGDANGDGAVDVSDFNIWNTNKFTSGTDWSTADFNGDGLTDVSDFNIWTANKFTSVGPFRPVPEPGSWTLLAGLLLGIAFRCRGKLARGM